MKEEHNEAKAQRAFADDPQRNPKRDDIQDEGPRELFINNPEHPLKVAQRKGKNTVLPGQETEEVPEPLYHPKPLRKETKHQ